MDGLFTYSADLKLIQIYMITKLYFFLYQIKRVEIGFHVEKIVILFFASLIPYNKTLKNH